MYELCCLRNLQHVESADIRVACPLEVRAVTFPGKHVNLASTLDEVCGGLRLDARCLADIHLLRAVNA